MTALEAIAAGDPAGIAVAYDRCAAGLYGYCDWMLHQPAHAAEAVREAFVVAATLGDLPEAPELRPWLYAVARNECLRPPMPPASKLTCRTTQRFRPGSQGSRLTSRPR